MPAFLETNRDDIEFLAREECFELLGEATIGRIGLTIRGLPAVVPVKFSLVDDRIVIDARQDARLVATIRGQVVAFEVDGFETGDADWSVAVTGRAFEFVDGHGTCDSVGITTELVSGRRTLKIA
jgi:nitroimidazol reductase NimA-like FMN-containing flavoprotein (pyridoxamine 5'-phosphate oxidase superfamily)